MDIAKETLLGDPHLKENLENLEIEVIHKFKFLFVFFNFYSFDFLLLVL